MDYETLGAAIAIAKSIPSSAGARAEAAAAQAAAQAVNAANAVNRLVMVVEEVYPLEMVPGGVSTEGDLNNENQLLISRRSGWIPYFGEPLTVYADPGITAYLRIYDKDKRILAPTGPGSGDTDNYIRVTGSTSPMTVVLTDYTEDQIAYFRFIYTCGNQDAVALLTDGCAYVTHGKDFVTERDLNRVTSLDGTRLATMKTVDAVGIPVYVEDLTEYPAYGLTEKGWYVFARIRTRDGVTVNEQTQVTGADGSVVTAGADHVDVAVRFEVASQAKIVTIGWGTYEETFIFRAQDLAVRNLDYRTTFYIYDISRYVSWQYQLTADTAFAANKKYYTKDGDTYTLAEVQTVQYNLTADATFQTGKKYYIREGDVYTEATVTAGEAVTPDTYYEQTTVPVPAYYVQTHPYALTTDATFQDGVTYYTKGEDDTYTAAEVTVGEAVTPETYYVQTTAYVQATDATFQDGVTYYTKTGTEYTEAVVTTGDPIPAYYNHSKLHFEGMAPNITYRLDTTVDCPIEIVLPEVADDGHGAWFEIQMRFDGSYSITLLPPAGAQIGTAQTQAQTAGINTVDLQYTCVDGLALWTLLNTHTNPPAAT